MFLFFNPIYFLFIIPPLIFMFYAQYRVSSTYNRFSKLANTKKVTGGQAAQTLLRYNVLTSINVEGIKGQLTDHYDPSHKVLRLSQGVYNNASVAALGIVAHEVGHAVQDKVRYTPMRIRAALVPAASLGTNLGYIFVIIGFILYGLIGLGFGYGLIWVGIFLFTAMVLFSLVTLPVEYDASRRARLMLHNTGLVTAEEYEGASAVLSAAALTYVAATLQALANLFYFVFMALGMGRRG